MKTLLSMLFCASAFALSSAPASAADTYTIDPTHSIPTFSYHHFGLSTPRSRFDGISGTITLDLAKKTGSADVTIDANSVSTGVPKFNDHLKSADFLDTAKYPTITFKSSNFKFKGDKLVSVAGDLSIHGVTKPVTLDVTRFHCADHPMKKVPACGADAVTTIKRTDFGVGAYAPNVGDELRLELTVEALKSK